MSLACDVLILNFNSKVQMAGQVNLPRDENDNHCSKLIEELINIIEKDFTSERI